MVPHGNSRLTWGEVAEIRELKGRGTFFSSRLVAEMFGVSQNTVLHIWRGTSWRSK